VTDLAGEPLEHLQLLLVRDHRGQPEGLQTVAERLVPPQDLVGHRLRAADQDGALGDCVVDKSADNIPGTLARLEPRRLG